MKITELSEEYQQEADLLETKINSLKEKLQTKDSYGKEVYILRKRIKMLSDVRHELIGTAKMLRDYYKK